MLLVTVQRRDGRAGTFPIWPSVEFAFESDPDTKTVNDLWEDSAPKSWHYKLAYYAALKGGAVELGEIFDKWIDTVSSIKYSQGDDAGNPTSAAEPQNSTPSSP